MSNVFGNQGRRRRRPTDPDAPRVAVGLFRYDPSGRAGSHSEYQPTLGDLQRRAEVVADAAAGGKSLDFLRLAAHAFVTGYDLGRNPTHGPGTAAILAELADLGGALSASPHRGDAVLGALVNAAIRRK